MLQTKLFKAKTSDDILLELNDFINQEDISVVSISHTYSSSKQKWLNNIEFTNVELILVYERKKGLVLEKTD